MQISAELKVLDTTTVTLHIEETTHSFSESTYQTQLNWSSNNTDTEPKPERSPGAVSSTHQVSLSTSSDGWRQHRRESEDDDDIDFGREKRTQKYIVTMVTLFATCWCPISILILVTHFVYEHDDNTGGFDITYLTFTFFGYLSTCINPILFAYWRMSEQTKDRLRGYFRFSNRRHTTQHTALGRVSEVTINHNTLAPRMTSTDDQQA